MKTCCFCFDLKHGVNASATFVLVTKIIAIIAFSIFLAVPHRSKLENAPSNEVYETNKERLSIYLSVGIGVSALYASFSVMLIIGVQKNIKCLLFPWMILTGLQITGGVIITFIFLYMIFVSLSFYWMLHCLGIVVWTSFYAYMLWGVVAYYKWVSRQDSDTVANVPYTEMEKEKYRV